MPSATAATGSVIDAKDCHQRFVTSGLVPIKNSSFKRTLMGLLFMAIPVREIAETRDQPKDFVVNS